MKYDYGFWGVVALHIAWLVAFALAFLRPRRWQEWRSFGAFSGFVVALYVEMYGFPLTIYLLAGLVGGLRVPEPFEHLSGNLWATLVFGRRAAGPLMLLGGLLMLAGTIVLSVAWRTLYLGRGALVTRGLYAAVRHPQYSALLLIVLGALIQWPTIPTLVMAPVLTASYVRLARREDRKMEARFAEAYRTYRQRVPGFVPALPLPVRERPRDARETASSRK